jgi:diguanylate cyclase (GGDEF)-like protein/PAS domain S-box-containing protein
VDTLYALRASRKLLDKHIMSSTTDTNGVITEFSSAAAQAFEVERKSMIGKTHASVRHPSTSPKVHKELWNTILSGRPWQGELKNQTSSGKTLWIETVITPRINDQGEVYGFTQISHDITLHKAMEALSSTDSLTETHNRRKLDQLLEQQAQRYKRADEEFAIIIIDIDHFKQINDVYGHQTGDKVLIDVANSLKETGRQIDEVGRWGGEEFLVICPLTDLKGALKLAEKLRTAIATQAFLPDKQITASFGVAQYHSEEATNHLVHRADLALYDAKSQGRNRVIAAPNELSEQVHSKT